MLCLLHAAAGSATSAVEVWSCNQWQQSSSGGEGVAGPYAGAQEPAGGSSCRVSQSGFMQRALFVKPECSSIMHIPCSMQVGRC